MSTSVVLAKPSILGICTPATAAVTSCLVAKPEISGIAVTSALVDNLSSVSALV